MPETNPPNQVLWAGCELVRKATQRRSTVLATKAPYEKAPNTRFRWFVATLAPPPVRLRNMHEKQLGDDKAIMFHCDPSISVTDIQERIRTPMIWKNYLKIPKHLLASNLDLGELSYFLHHQPGSPLRCVKKTPLPRGFGRPMVFPKGVGLLLEDWNPNTSPRNQYELWSQISGCWTQGVKN